MSGVQEVFIRAFLSAKLTTLLELALIAARIQNLAALSFAQCHLCKDIRQLIQIADALTNKKGVT